MIRCFLILFYTLFFFSIDIFTIEIRKNLNFDKITTRDGLSINTISGMCQDSRGFLWIATIYGLNRYDGYSFKKFYPDLSGENSINSSSLSSLIEDKNKNIWIGTNRGISKYSISTGLFLHFESYFIKNPQKH